VHHLWRGGSPRALGPRTSRTRTGMPRQQPQDRKAKTERPRQKG
jgi:hypothetical protein